MARGFANNILWGLSFLWKDCDNSFTNAKSYKRNC